MINFIQAVAEVKKSNGFERAELKSSKIGSDYKRRSRILSQLLMIDFRVVLFIADKQAFIQGSPLTNYKESFIKFLHQRLYNLLYHVYPKLKIIEDEIGTTEFQASFRKYVQNNRPQMNLLNEYDFDYVDSKDELLVQLADMVGGSIGHSLTDNSAPDYLEMLKGKIIAREDFPNKMEPYWGPRIRQTTNTTKMFLHLLLNVHLTLSLSMKTRIQMRDALKLPFYNIYCFK